MIQKSHKNRIKMRDIRTIPATVKLQLFSDDQPTLATPYDRNADEFSMKLN